MYDLLDYYAQSSALRGTNPRIKLLLGMGAILFCVFSATPIAPLFVAVTIGLITITMAKIPKRFYTKLLIVPLSFAMLSSVLFLRSWEQGERLMITMYARCYNGKLDLLEQAGKSTPEALFAVVAYLAIVAAIAVLTRDIQML
jgi:energy-coupling factor transporter transmembrane protein EcfT